MKSICSLVFAGMVLLLSACATTPVPPNIARSAPVDRLLAFQAKPIGPFGTIVVVRDGGMTGSGCYYAVSINGTLAARLDPEERASFFVQPGELLLRSGRDPQGKGLCATGQSEWTQRETLLREGEVKHFRLSIDGNGKTDIQRTDP